MPQAAPPLLKCLACWEAPQQAAPSAGKLLMKTGGNMFAVKPFKHHVQDPEYSQKTWKVLEDAIQKINNHNTAQSTSVSTLSFEELYRAAYNMVLHKFGDRLYEGVTETLQAHLQGVANEVEAQHGVRFLPDLRQRWNDHKNSMQMIRDILMYMDRTWVVQHDKAPTHELGLQLWKEGIVREPRIATRLTATMLDMVERERGGEAIDQGLMRAVTQMLSDLGGGVYADDFERAFLAASASFYAAEAQTLLAECDCPEYLRRSEARLAEESERCRAYLDASSAPKVQAVVEEQLLGRHLRSLLDMPASGLMALLDGDAFEDLARLYALLRRPGVRDGLKTLREGMAAHLREQGRLLVGELPDRAGEAGASNPSQDFVQCLLAEKDKYDALIARAFAGDKTFQNAAAGAFEYFINLNVRAPEYISLFVDEFLRKGLKGASEDESELLLDKVMMLFRFLQEKDVFEKYYKQHLAKRLLGGRTVSDDAERSFILKLKTECGYQFTSKIEGMFTDMRTSRDTMAAWRSADAGEAGDPAGWPADSVPRDALSVQVLTTGSWPTSPGAHCNLPAELERCSEAFRAFYLGKHTGRRLVWQANMGNADLRATFGASKHELNVSTYHMVILLLFNAADALSYAELAAQTAIPSADLKRSLQSLACVKGKNVLRKEPAGKEVEDGDVFHFNDRFTCKLHKVKIGTVAAAKESEPEKAETRQRIEDDRKPQIEAAIVRVMKSRRVMDHNAIIAEVSKQLGGRFMPNPVVVKKRIESLIEREFLERDRNDRKLYRYVA